MKLPGRQFLHLAAGTVALPDLSVGRASASRRSSSSRAGDTPPNARRCLA
jgi:hypothetical protein